MFPPSLLASLAHANEMQDSSNGFGIPQYSLRRFLRCHEKDANRMDSIELNRAEVRAGGIVAWPHGLKPGSTFTCCFCKAENTWQEGMVVQCDAIGQRFACKKHLNGDRLFTAVFADYLSQAFQQEWLSVFDEFWESDYEQDLC